MAFRKDVARDDSLIRYFWKSFLCDNLSHMMHFCLYKMNAAESLGLGGGRPSPHEPFLKCTLAGDPGSGLGALLSASDFHFLCIRVSSVLFVYPL